MRRSERGYALVTILALIMLAITIWWANKLPAMNQSLADQNVSTRRLKAREQLEGAKTRLIQLALSNVHTPGALPCPDYLNNGQNNNLCTTAPYAVKPPGRNPYVILSGADAAYDMRPPLMQQTTNGERECLWYAVSPVFGKWISNELRQLSPPAGSPGRGQLNPDAALNLFHQDAPIIAVLIAPGDPLDGQSRSAALSPSYCRGGNLEDFLESYIAPTAAEPSKARYKDFSGLSARNSGSGLCELQADIEPKTAVAPNGECNNDVILPIKRDDLMRPLIREVLARLAAEPADAGHSLLLTLPASGTGTLASLRDPNIVAFDGKAYLDMDLGDPEANGCLHSTTSRTPLWMCSNGWYRYIDYDASAQTLSITLNKGTATAYRCELAFAKVPKEVVCR